MSELLGDQGDGLRLVKVQGYVGVGEDDRAGWHIPLDGARGETHGCSVLTPITAGDTTVVILVVGVPRAYAELLLKLVRRPLACQARGTICCNIRARKWLGSVNEGKRIVCTSTASTMCHSLTLPPGRSHGTGSDMGYRNTQRGGL